MTLRFASIKHSTCALSVPCVDVSVLFPAQADMPPLAFVSSLSQPHCSAAQAVLSVNATMSNKVASGKRINVSSAVGLLCAALVDCNFESSNTACESQLCPPLASPEFAGPCSVGVDFLLAFFQAACLGIRRGSICPTLHLPPLASPQQAAAASLQVPTLAHRRTPKSSNDNNPASQGLLAWLCFCSHAQLRFLGCRVSSSSPEQATRVLLSPGVTAVDRETFAKTNSSLPHATSAFLTRSLTDNGSPSMSSTEGVPTPTFELQVVLPHSEHFEALKRKHGIKRAYQ